MANLTKRSVDALKPRGKLYIVFDGGVKGFGVRTCRPASRRSSWNTGQVVVAVA